jgi:hypothetical protein
MTLSDPSAAAGSPTSRHFSNRETREEECGAGIFFTDHFTPFRTGRDIAIVGASLIPGTPTEAICSRKVFGFGTGLKRAGRRKLHHTGLLSQPESSAHILQANGYRLYLGRNILSGTGITFISERYSNISFTIRIPLKPVKLTLCEHRKCIQVYFLAPQLNDAGRLRCPR